jgi:hypothetical protein
MRNARIFAIIGVITLAVVTIALAKVETDSSIAGCVVLYGKNGSNIIPIKVDTDGTVFIK